MNKKTKTDIVKVSNQVIKKLGKYIPTSEEQKNLDESSKVLIKLQEKYGNDEAITKFNRIERFIGTKAYWTINNSILDEIKENGIRNSYHFFCIESAYYSHNITHNEYVELCERYLKENKSFLSRLIDKFI